jgi:hypothetical protein
MVPSHAAEVEVTLIFELASNRAIAENLQHSILWVHGELRQAASVQHRPFPNL